MAVTLGQSASDNHIIFLKLYFYGHHLNSHVAINEHTKKNMRANVET